MEKRKTTIGNREETVIKCPVCKVWIVEEKYQEHKGSAKCKEYQKGKAIREKASKSATRAFRELTKEI